MLIASDAGLLPNECGAKSGHNISSSSCLSSADSSSLFEMDTIDLLLSPFNPAYAAFLQSCAYLECHESCPPIESDIILPASASLQSLLSADLVQIDSLPDLPMVSDDELLALALADISPAHQALHALDLHLFET